METKLEQIAVKAVNQLPKSVVREIRTPRSVGAGGGRPPPATRWMWKRSHGRTTKAPPDERGGNRYVQPKATAPHLDSTAPRIHGELLKLGLSVAQSTVAKYMV